jgi:hypothetical protein
LCGSDSVSLRLTAADGKEHAFSFDHVFGPAASQANVFAQVADVVQSALDGYNVCPSYKTCLQVLLPCDWHVCANFAHPAQVCLFSYGQTGAGKTHTMQGGSGTQQGIIPRSVHKVRSVLFQSNNANATAQTPSSWRGLDDAMQILEAVDALREQGWQYHLEASYIEVYNETLRDLLAAGNTKRDGARLLDASAIKHDPAGTNWRHTKHGNPDWCCACAVEA